MSPPPLDRTSKAFTDNSSFRTWCFALIKVTHVFSFGVVPGFVQHFVRGICLVYYIWFLQWEWFMDFLYNMELERESLQSHPSPPITAGRHEQLAPICGGVLLAVLQDHTVPTNNFSSILAPSRPDGTNPSPIVKINPNVNFICFTVVDRLQNVFIFQNRLFNSTIEWKTSRGLQLLNEAYQWCHALNS